MQILFAIAILSFLVLAWASFAVTRHIRRNTHAVSPGPAVPGIMQPKVSHAADRPRRDRSGQRYDRTFAHADAGNLNDPDKRVQSKKK